MAEEASAGGADQVQSGGSEQTKQDDKVAYETYKKTVDAEKKAKQKADELAKKVKEYEEKELAAQGKNAELIESLRKDNLEKDEKLKNVVGTFGYRAVENSIKAEAAKYGCLDSDLLIKASREDFSKIEVDVENGFSVNSDDLKRFFESKVKEHPTMFKQSGPKIHDAAPGNKSSAEKKFDPSNLAGLKTEDRKKLL